MNPLSANSQEFIPACLLLVALMVVPGLSDADDLFSKTPVAMDEEILPVDEAFHFGSYIEEDGDAATTRVFWQVMPGYFLYRDKFSFMQGDQVLNVALAEGEWFDDETFGRVRVLEGLVEVDLPTDQPLTVGYQGCAARGFCYPPQKKLLNSEK